MGTHGCASECHTLRAEAVSSLSEPVPVPTPKQRLFMEPSEPKPEEGCRGLPISC